MLLKIKVDKRIKLEKILEHEFMTKNRIPTELPDRYLRVPPSIKFIKRFYPNAELAKKQKKTAVVPEVVFPVEDETSGPKILNKREVLHLRNEMISKNRIDTHAEFLPG